MPDAVSILASQIASISTSQKTLQSNLTPNDPSVGYVVAFPQNVQTQGTTIAQGYTLATNSFYIDHPVYGYVNSPTLKLDGPYATNSITIPVTIPVTLGRLITTLYTSTW